MMLAALRGVREIANYIKHLGVMGKEYRECTRAKQWRVGPLHTAQSANDPKLMLYGQWQITLFTEKDMSVFITLVT